MNRTAPQLEMRRPLQHALTLALVATFGLALTACQKPATTSTYVPTPDRKPEQPPSSEEPAPSLQGPPGLPTAALAKLGSDDAEVHLAQRDDQWLVVTRAEGEFIALFDEPVTFTEAPESGAASLAVSRHGFVFVWSDDSDPDGGVWRIDLSPKGKVKAGKRLVVRTGAPVRWIETLRINEGIGLVIQSATGHQRQRLAYAQLDDTLKKDLPPPSLKPIAEDVNAWQIAGGPDDHAIAWVSASQAEGGNPATGRVFARRIHPTMSETVTLCTSPSALGDVQLARNKSGYLSAWTDRRGGSAEIRGAAFEPSGKVTAPDRALLGPLGVQVLVSLVSSPAHSHHLLAWERPGQSAARRTIRLQSLEGHGKLGSHRARMRFSSYEGLPSFAASEDGYVALTVSPLSTKEPATKEPATKEPATKEPATKETAKAAPPVVPSFIRLGTQLELTGGEPIRSRLYAASAGIPGVVNRLRCDGAQCRVVGRGPGKPSLLTSIELPARQSAFQSAWRPARSTKVARMAALKPLGALDAPVADIDSLRLDDGRHLVAWVSHVTADQDGKPRPAPAGATLSYRFIGKDGVPGPVHVLSKRAISLGGVALARAGDKKSRRGNHAVALVAWAGPSRGASQVYVTKISAKQKRLRQTTVTKIQRPQKGAVPNEVADVTIAHDPRGGYIVAWADTRDGQSEIYAARLNRRLEKRVRDKRLTVSAAHAHEPDLAFTSNALVVSWAESQGKRASVLVRPLNRNSLHPTRKPISTALLVKGPNEDWRHYAPRLASHGPTNKVWLSYLADENVSAGDGTVRGNRLELVAFDASGKRLDRRSIPVEGSQTINSYALSCQATLSASKPKQTAATECRTVLLVRPDAGAHEQVELEAHAVRIPNSVPLADAAIERHAVDTVGRSGHQDAGLTAAGADLGMLLFSRDEPSGSVLESLRLHWTKNSPSAGSRF